MAAAQAKAFDALVASLQKDTSGALPLVEQLSESVRRHELAFPNGISLLTVKVDALLAYVQQLLLLCAHKLRQRSLNDEVGARAVQTLVKLRLVLEKVRPMEARLRYQIEKLVRAASAEAAAATGAPASADGAEFEEGNDEEIDPLAFRPNPAALAAAAPRGAAADREQDTGGRYVPPKLAPVMYDPDARPSRRARDKERMPSRNAALLADLSAGMSSSPYETSMAGVGGGGAVGTSGSSRARALRRMQDFEEENYMRLPMNKRDARRRRRDEADVALGGLGLSAHGNRVGGGVEEEFGDLLREPGRRKRNMYDELQKRSKVPKTLERAARRNEGEQDDTLVRGGSSSRKFKKAVREQKRRARK